jgi:hypothetical protein
MDDRITSEGRKAVAVALVTKLGDAGVIARLFGGSAFALIADWDHVFGVPRPIPDIDLVVDQKSFYDTASVIVGLGGSVDRASLSTTDARMLRAQYENIKVDVFSDPLKLNQEIRIGSRLTLEIHTLSRADLLATKFQIEHRADRDLRDVLALLATSSTGTPKSERYLDQARIAQLCSSNWGFHYSSLRWIADIRRRLEDIRLSDGFALIIQRNIESILAAIMSESKPWYWKLRNLAGPRIRWYAEIDDNDEQSRHDLGDLRMLRGPKRIDD